MNNHEMIKHFPEIKKNKVDELWVTLNNLKFEAYEEFEFDKKKFLLIPLEPEDIDEDGDAWFASSTAIDGIDIYILTTLSIEEKRKKIFHEVIEAWAQINGFFDERSHAFAIQQEQKFFTTPE